MGSEFEFDHIHSILQIKSQLIFSGQGA